MTVIGNPDNRMRLLEGVRSGRIDVLDAVSDGHACYLCGESIYGKMVMLVERGIVMGVESKATYPLDHGCYDNLMKAGYLGGARMPEG